MMFPPENSKTARPRSTNPLELNLKMPSVPAKPFGFVSGIVVCWWYREKTYKIVENISFIITKEVDEFSGCDHGTIQGVVNDTLKQICVDDSIFNPDDVCFKRKETLFECKAEIDTRKFGCCIVEAIFKNVRLSITSCCVLYSAPRITGKSFSIETEKIHVLHKNDNEAWSKLNTLGYCFDDWSPISGKFIDGIASALIGENYHYIFIAELVGTTEGNKLSASLKFRKLFSVICALIEREYRFKVMAKPNSFCIQVPHKSTARSSFIQSEIGELLPYYGSELIISKKDVLNIQDWYQLGEYLSIEQKSRIEKCAHFINKGMNDSDIDSYIHYFVALDALFGNMGSVYKSIEEGVKGLPGSSLWSAKLSWLYDLRNELVHGGSRYIREWPKYMRYYKHFSSEPEKDIESLALYALALAPYTFYNSKSSSKMFSD